MAHELEPRPSTTATEVRCECGHETTVFPFSFMPWVEEVPDRIQDDPSVAIADEDGLFTCAGCERSIYVPSASLN